MRLARPGAYLVPLALVLVAGCKSDPPPRHGDGTHADPPEPTPRPSRPLGPPDAIAKVCAAHLELLHRVRLARELGPELSKLAGPAPTPEQFGTSLAAVRDVGIDGTDAQLSRAGTFATAAQPAVQSAGLTFVAWTKSLDDVGLAKIQKRRPGSFRELWGKAVSYEVLLLDGFRVRDYPALREEILEHQEGPSETPRRRGNLLIVDAAAIASDAQLALADTRLLRANLRAAVQSAKPDDLVRQIELREACYLRFQDEAKSPAALDRLATWLEILEGDCDLALAGNALCSGDRPDERRRSRTLEAIVNGPATGTGSKEDLSKTLALPRDERSKKLKELAPYFLRSELEH